MSKTFVKKEITPEVIETFLNGHDSQERIVNIDYSYQDNFITVYYRNENDEKCVSKEPFMPFLWATKDACIKLCNGDKRKVSDLLKQYRIWVKSLDVTNSEGNVVEEIKKNGYTYMFYATSPMSYSKFLEFFKKAGNPVSSRKNKNDNNGTKQKEERQYLSVTPKEQFMISTGKRFFKGYEDYNDILRLIFDLESTGLNTKKDRIIQIGIRFNRPVKYKGNYITFEKILTTEGNTEEEKNISELNNIISFLKIIYTFRPDVITAHNGEAFDWNLLIGACERLGTSMEELSKRFFNGKPIYKDENETILKLGGEIEKFHRTVVPNIIITDSLHAVRRAQATDSNFKEANLKYSAKYLELKKENRVYVPGDEISSVQNDLENHYAFNEDNGDWYLFDKECGNEFVFDGNTKRKAIRKFNSIGNNYKLVTGKYIVERYLLDDLWECDKVELSLNQSAFNICKCLPLPFQKCCTMGTAGQWKALMLAWSYENDLAIPYAVNTGCFTGGLSRLLAVGYTGLDKDEFEKNGEYGLVKLDYNSLYPSIILTWGIEDVKDLSGATLKFLNYFLTTRETYKGKKKAANKIIEKYEEKINIGEQLSKEEKDEYDKALNYYALNDNLQALRKVFCNSFFGSYGSNNGAVYPWKSVDCAERTTCTGRQSLRLMIGHFSKIGEKNGLGNEYDYKPIVGDSFTEDTPLFIKYKDSGLINIVPIMELIEEKNIEIDDLGREYDYSKKPFYILCRSGWVEPSYIYRHKTDKDIYEVIDNDTIVEVTEDHSLFDSEKNKIKPSEINENTKLEYFDGTIYFPITTHSESQSQHIKEMAFKLAKGQIDRVPVKVLNSSNQFKELFYKIFMENYDENVKFSKTCLAGLLFIKNNLK